MTGKRVMAAGIILALTIVLSSGCAKATTPGGILQGQQEGIWVTGTGKVAVVPDVASISLGIESQEASVTTAQSKATEAMNLVMSALTDQGVAEKDIQTQRFSISQVTRWDDERRQEVVIGYRVSNIVTAKVRTLDKLGIVIDSVAVAGGDLTRINSIYFSVDEPSVHYGEAREKAMEQAGVTAKQLANLGGVGLGKPTYISESTAAPPIIRPGEAMGPMPAPAAPTPISPGEMEISLSVQVVYAIAK